MTPETFLDGRVTLWQGDVRAVLAQLPADHFDCVVTSPPYWGLRDYGTGRWEGGAEGCDHRESSESRTAASVASSTLLGGKNGIHRSHQFKGECGKCGAIRIDAQLGLERTLGEHLSVMVDVFREVRRVLKPTGTLWLNYGDCYATSPNGRSAADTKAAGNDDWTFRDKPFSTVGAIFETDHEAGSRVGKNGNKGNAGADNHGRVVAGGFLKPKDLCMIPNRLAIALQDDGWWVRSEIVWHKPNAMPESIKDRPGNVHEKIWLLTKNDRYFYDAEAVKEARSTNTHPRVAGWADGPGSHNARDHATAKANGTKFGRALGVTPKSAAEDTNIRAKGSFHASTTAVLPTRNLRNVWSVLTEAFPEAHFATFPTEIAERCIKAGSAEGGEILDPFGGSGTVALVAATLGRRATLIELNPEYCTLARARIEAAFMGREEGSRHMTKQLGRMATDPGPLFADPPYDAEIDFGKSIEVAYQAMRERMANGGPGWEPKE